MNANIDKNNIETLFETRFLKLYDLRYAPGKHYFVASRNSKENLTSSLSDEEFKRALPDAVSVAVVVRVKGDEPRLLMSYEYRYAVGQFLLSPVAGLVDAEDKKQPEPLISAAVREIKEETGLTVKESDTIRVLNACAFSTPGMTDESNAFLLADISLDDLDSLTQSGAEGSELFNGFELLDKERARKIFENGRDENGNFYSLAAWMVLSIFLSTY